MIAFYPIKPVYIDRILQGEKKYELRRKLPKTKIEYVFLYATSPVCQVVGYAKVGLTLNESKESLWKKLSPFFGLNENDFFDYFEGVDNACAIELLEVFKFKEPFHPKVISKNFVVPQSFRYIEKEVFNRFKNRESFQVEAIA